MLTTHLTHPPLLEALARAGHGSKVLIADANYPFSTAGGPNSTSVYLNVAPGLLTVDQVLEVLRKTMPIEAALTMRNEADELAPPHAGYQKAFGDALEIGSAGRWEFYDLARGADLAVLIASGDQRPCANLLLTVGVRPAQ
ncbi:RbsD or FucU transport [Curtobacterium flaccumfaciens]|uniref:RbsD/FucU family protein n=1 Tax=Curtobacterium flaccumfaciens TaxID=2035 RepID=UPI00188B47BE|nr:RbsD/FucU family protein [Curtobacterium flaccumfaciens]MBF4595657.1 RbsD or FucU transport [Curtobacterium flaccumfaciens]